jgi:hypothetical protein
VSPGDALSLMLVRMMPPSIPWPPATVYSMSVCEIKSSGSTLVFRRKSVRLYTSSSETFRLIVGECLESRLRLNLCASRPSTPNQYDFQELNGFLQQK